MRTEREQKLAELQKLQRIKLLLLNTINQKKKNRSIQGDYRSKANKIYKDKLRKVFHPLKMEQYQDILNFQEYFQEYLENSDKLKQIAENNKPYMNQTIRRMSKKDIFQTNLTLNIDQLCQLTKTKKIKNLQLTSQSIEGSSLQSVKKIPSILKKNHSRIKNYNQSPILLNRNSRYDDRNQVNSPLKRSNISIEQSSIKSSSKSLIKNRRKSISKFQQVYTQQKIIEKINQINGSNLSNQIFRMTIQTFKDYLTCKFGNQIFSTYYNMPESLSSSKICDILNTFNQSSQKQKLMIVFLTFDLNKDGFICEQDLFRIAERIDMNSPLKKDIFKISQFCRKDSYIEPKQSFLPKQFYENPKRKLYLKLFQNQNRPQSSRLQLPIIKNRIQYFTMDLRQSQKDQLSYTKIEKDHKKQIRINFRMFEQIFKYEMPEFLELIKSCFSKQETQFQKPFSIKLRRQLTLSYDGKKHSQSLQLRNSGKSLKNNPNYLSRSIQLKRDRNIKIQSKRSITQTSCNLNNLIKYKSDRKSTSSTLQVIQDIKKQCQTNDIFKKPSINKKSMKQSKLSLKMEDNCKIEDQILPQKIIQKLNVFKKDQSNFHKAYGLLKYHVPLSMNSI